jgi:2-oxoglutarate dehydrogenase E1 component
MKIAAEAENWPNPLSLAFVEELYARYAQDPASVPADWQAYFERLQTPGVEEVQIGPSFQPPTLFDPMRDPSRAGRVHGDGHARENGNGRTYDAVAARVADMAVLQDRVDQLIRAFRVRGHMIAEIDPLGLPRPHQPELDPEYYDLTSEDLDRKFSARTISGGGLTLREILQRLHVTYCGSIGVQFMHIDDPVVKNWLQERMERTDSRVPLTRDEQLRILTKLTDAVIFEEFVQRKFLGAKRFSLEGSESLIPLLMFAIDRAAEHGVDEIVMGMAHRGRLNVLANIMGKSPREIFREFEDDDPEHKIGSGDVKYHLGYSSDWLTPSGKKVHLSLSFNPSHLEIVNPVVLGRTRAKQDRAADTERTRKVALLIHGDAAFAGEGIVQETLNLSQLKAYSIGGTIHVIVNNQIGFTTPPSEGRSTTYATDVAKMLQIPIFHVNGEDPEAVAQVIRLAMDFRETFGQDVVIDMYGYRRHGHNESDEPSFTQPLLYQAIAERPSVRDGYLENLLKLGQVSRDEADQIAVERREELDRQLSEARRKDFVVVQDWLGGYWKGYCGGREEDAPNVETSVSVERLRELLVKLNEVPEGFTVHKTLQRLLKDRRSMAFGEKPLDWGAAEMLALGTLATDGYRIRMTGQDCARGTFSHRHAVLHDVEDGQLYMPVCHLAPQQAPVEIWNSALCETGVMGYEYGYSLDWPDGLVVWEAQFGDFFNVAQPIVDQFIVSAEDKWRRLSGLVLLLPHGFEGQGPEHSSARIERFLLLAAEHNIQVAQPTTPAQYFHLLRRQVHRPWRKPLIVFTPKSLLRHPKAVSTIEECAEGEFHRILPDPEVPPQEAQHVFLCTGRIYYDLIKHREDLGRKDVAILRVEQLYPRLDHFLEGALAPYRDGIPVTWVQDEPENMGSWRFLRYLFGTKLLGRFPFSGVYRPESASPATGSANAHKLEQKRLLAQAFG